MKQDFKIGEEVILDKEYNNSSTVIIARFTPNKLFSTVYAKENPKKELWEVMTNRLSKKD